VVTVRYWAAARAAAGQAEEVVAAGTVGELMDAIAERHDMGRVLAVCSLLVDGTQVRPSDSDHRLPDTAVVDVLPPFAGG
jgi:sulfur-carrier protein